MISSSVTIPVIASGGAGRPEHLRAVLDEGQADAALVASITHFGEYTISQLKDYLTSNGIKVRTAW
jgi:cyclase